MAAHYNLPCNSMAAAEGLAHSNLFVKSALLSTPDFDEAALTKIFAPYGHIDSCRLVIKPKHSIAFVRFSTIDEAEAALSLNNTQVSGYTLEVKLADADAGPPAAGNLQHTTPWHLLVCLWQSDCDLQGPPLFSI